MVSKIFFLLCIEKPTVAAAPVVKAVAVKRIPSYDYKARFNDLSERHAVLKEKYAQVESKVDDADRMEQEIAVYQEEVGRMAHSFTKKI